MYKFYYSISLVFLLIGLQMFSSPVFSGCSQSQPITNSGQCTKNLDCGPGSGGNGIFCNINGMCGEPANVCWYDESFFSAKHKKSSKSLTK